VVIRSEIIYARDLKELEKDLMTMSIKMLKLEIVSKIWSLLLKARTLIIAIFK